MWLAVPLGLVWLAWLVYGWWWEISWKGPEAGWLLGPDKRMMVEPWRIYDVYRFLLGYAVTGLFLAWGIKRTLIPARPGTRPFPYRVAASLLTAMAVLALLEWSVRVYEDRFRPVDMMYMIPDPSLVWKVKPRSSDEINGLGLRSRAVTQEPMEGEIRVLCIGDSCTFGVGVPAKDAYPAQLEAVLREKFPGRKITVLNAGVPGYSSLQGYNYLVRDGLALKPDYVIWSFAHTDVNSASRPDRIILASQARTATTLADLLHRSHLYLFLHSELNRLRGGTEDPDGMRVPPAEARVVLRDAARAAKAAGARLIVLQTPDRQLDDPQAASGELGNRERNKLEHRRALRAEAKGLEIPFIDPTTAFLRRGMVRCFLAGDTIHPSGVGSAAIAEVLGPQLLRVMAGQPLLPETAATDGDAYRSADLKTLRKELALMPHYALLWGLARLFTEDGAPHFFAAEGGAVLSILRQGPVQMDAQADQRVRDAFEKILTPAQKELVRRATHGSNSYTVVSLNTGKYAAQRDAVGDGGTRMGPILGGVLDGLSNDLRVNWLELPIDPMVGGPLSVPPAEREPLVGLLYGILALHDYAGPERLTSEQSTVLLPALISLMESADFALPHRRALIELLNESQGRWILRAWTAARQPPIPGDPIRGSSAAEIPFVTAGELFAAYARHYRLPSGEPAVDDGQGRTALSVPYPDLIWGVKALDDGGPPLTPEQAGAIASVMERLVDWTRDSQPVYASVGRAVKTTLNAKQWAFVRSHSGSPESIAADLRGQTPAGADIIGYALLQVLRKRASVHPFAVAGIPPPRAGAAPVNPGALFAAILDMDRNPDLGLDPHQARTLLPYVRAAMRANDVNHLVKERIAETLTEEQRRFISEALRKRGPTATVRTTPGEVIQALRQRVKAL